MESGASSCPAAGPVSSLQVYTSAALLVLSPSGDHGLCTSVHFSGVHGLRAWVVTLSAASALPASPKGPKDGETERAHIRRCGASGRHSAEYAFAFTQFVMAKGYHGQIFMSDRTLAMLCLRRMCIISKMKDPINTLAILWRW